MAHNISLDEAVEYNFMVGNMADDVDTHIEEERKGDDTQPSIPICSRPQYHGK